MLVYGRKLLEGLPKRYVNIELKPKNWKELKNGLRQEYGKEKNSALIHKKMSNSRIMTNENFSEYLYRMIEMAGDQIETKALITYIVDGLNDNVPNKLFLYNAKRLQELKDRINSCQDIRPKKKYNLDSRQKVGRNDQSRPTRNRCFSCGDTRHTIDQCGI